MKKIIAILLSLALLLGCAAGLAEGAEKQSFGTIRVNGEFTLKGSLPEGYKVIPFEMSDDAILKIILIIVIVVIVIFFSLFSQLFFSLLILLNDLLNGLAGLLCLFIRVDLGFLGLLLGRLLGISHGESDDTCVQDDHEEHTYH